MTYQNKIVRDLESVVFSKDLLISDKNFDNIFFKIPETEIDSFLLELDKDPVSINNFIGDRGSYRLGKYFEALLKFYFIWNRNVELIDDSVQVFEEKITLGEMDFILRDKINMSYIHLEVAVKFFARNGDSKSAYDYKCPNGQRNLGQKLDKTFRKQIRITEKQQTKKLLKEKGIDTISKKLYIKGCLFYNDLSDRREEQELLNPNSQKNQWIHFSEFKSLNNKSFYKIIPKIDWLSDDLYLDLKCLNSFLEMDAILEAHFKEFKQGLMLAEFHEIKGVFVQKSRFLVLDNSWPNIDKSHFDYKKLKAKGLKK